MSFLNKLRILSCMIKFVFFGREYQIVLLKFERNGRYEFKMLDRNGRLLWVIIVASFWVIRSILST